MFGKAKNPNELDPPPQAREDPEALEILRVWAVPGQEQQVTLRPVWKDLVPAAEGEQYHRSSAVPLLLDIDRRPLKRNFVHVDDLVAAMLAALDNPRARQQLFNISMDQPVDYGEVARYLARTRGLPAVEIKSAYHSNWMDNAKAKYLLDWRPDYDLEKLIEGAWTYRRHTDDPRRVWYPG